MSQQYKVYGDVVDEYYILVTAENRDEAWYAAVEAPKTDWQIVSTGVKIEPYNIEEVEL